MALPDFTATVPEMIRALAARHGDRELVVGSNRRLGFAEAERRSARMARGLLAAGVGKGTRVGLLFPNGPDWVLGFLAATRIGAIAVPLNTFMKARELGFVLRHADVQVLLAVPRFLTNDYLARLEEAAPGLAAASGAPLRVPELPQLRSVHVFGPERRPWAADGARLLEATEDGVPDAAFLRAVEASVTPADVLLVLYSSGSTADPKGAVHSHGAVVRHAFHLASCRDLQAGDRVWSPMPFFWVGGLVFALLGNAHAGACTLCEDVFDPEGTLAFLERERATHAVGWPHFGKALAEHPSRPARDLSALRRGNLPEILPPEICPLDPELRANALGMTETCGPHTWGGEGALPEQLRGSFGTAVPGVEHRVMDPATGALLGTGETGELCVRGPSLMQGLYKVEREATFDADGFYHTGDAGFFDSEGVLYFRGRLGEMIKTGGANVTPAEVEAVLVACPGVREAYVVGVPDPERGQNVAAAVVAAAGSTLAPAELLTHLRRDLSSYKVPRHLLVLERAELPFTDSAKIDRLRLASLLAERIAAASREDDYDPFEVFNRAQGAGSIRDPYPMFAVMRKTSAVHKLNLRQLLGPDRPLPPGAADEIYSVLSYDTVAEVLRDGKTFSSAGYSKSMGIVMGHTILAMDAPEHTRYRGLFHKAFTRKALERWETDLIRPVVSALVDRFAERGRAELVRELTFPFPVSVIAGMIGLAPEDHPRFHRSAVELISVGLDWERGMAASRSLHDLFAKLIAERRREPRDDLTSVLTHAELEGTRLSDEDIIAFLRLLAPAGAETTYRSSSNLILGLLRHPDQLEAVRKDRSLLPQAIEEGLRWEAPLLSIMRTATRDVEIGGTRIPAGGLVAVNLGAANRDETRWDRPDEFDIFREPKPHMAFAFGPHLCLGMHLARLETLVVVNELFDRLPELRLDPAADDVHITGLIFRSPLALPVAFGPA